MTTAAWITMGATWTVIGYFTVRFLLQVLRTPTDDENEGGAE